MFIELNLSDGKKMCVNSDYIEMILEVGDKTKIEMGERSIWVDSPILDITSQLMEKKVTPLPPVIKTDWAPSPSA